MITDFSIFLSTKCNFNCVYCDKSYYGAKSIEGFDLDKVISFYYNNLDKISKDCTVSFFGGEPFLEISNMDYLIDKINAKDYLIQTNGSLILENKDFIIKHKDKLYISISYDFTTQNMRKEIDIDKILEFLVQYLPKNRIQLQCVIQPQYLKDNPSNEFIDNILKIYKKHNIFKLSLIILKNVFKNSEYGIFTLKYLDNKNIFNNLKVYTDIFHRNRSSSLYWWFLWF